MTLLLLSQSGATFAAVDPITGAEPGEGWGGSATGGYGKEELIVTTFAQFLAAIKRDNVYIRVQEDLVATGHGIGSGSNITIDGGGSATIWGTASPTQGQRMFELLGKNIVIKDIRLRTSGDNLSFKAPAENILVSHVTTSGSYDDGISISYGTKNVTIQYCAFFGCTRSCFIKYDEPQNITLHHNWFKGQYQRGPLISTAYNVDVRNQIGEEWWWSGGPVFEVNSTGNCINSVFILTGATPGDKNRADHGDGSGAYYFNGSLYRGCAGKAPTSPAEIPCPSVTTHSAAEAEAIVRAKAGCLPRDAIDNAYIAATSWTISSVQPWIIGIPDVSPKADVTGPTSPTAASPILFTINFSKPVTGLAADGITVTNGVKGALSGSGSGPFVMPVTPASQGYVTCQVEAGAAQDETGLNNLASDTWSVVYDSVAPTATVSAPASPTTMSPIVFTIEFSEPVTGLTAAGITVSNGTKGTLTGSGAGPYTLEATPTGPGETTCRVNAGAAWDAAANGNTASNAASAIFTITRAEKWPFY